MRKLACCAVLALTSVGACGPTYTLTDDIDLTWDFGPALWRFDDDLHGPYVQGAKVTLFAYSSDDHPDFRGWTIRSTDPAVFRIDEVTIAPSGESLSARGVALAEGSAPLELLDDRGRAVGRARAEVLVPDRVELDAHGSLILGRDDEAPVGEARVIADGRATYLVRYFRGGSELHGNGVLSADAPAGVIAEPRVSFLFENREWLTLTTTAPLAGTLHLRADQRPVADIPIAVVPASDVVDVIVLTESEQHHAAGDWLVALAQAYDGAGRRVFGIDYAWNVDGEDQIGDGDLYRYRFQPGSSQMVQARYGTHTDAVTIQSDLGYVDSTNRVGCNAGGGAPLGAALALLGVLALRRSRRSPRRSRP